MSPFSALYGFSECLRRLLCFRFFDLKSKKVIMKVSRAALTPAPTTAPARTPVETLSDEELVGGDPSVVCDVGRELFEVPDVLGVKG
jgi:hypothetical protein